MASYRVRIKASAARELEAIPTKKILAQLVRRIDALAASPRPRGCEKLAGGADRYRIRHGVYRLVYRVDDELHLVEIVKIGHRKNIYR